MKQLKHLTLFVAMWFVTFSVLTIELHGDWFKAGGIATLIAPLKTCVALAHGWFWDWLLVRLGRGPRSSSSISSFT